MNFYIFLLLFISGTLANPQSRIVGGQTARGGQFPFSAAIYVTKSVGTYFCGGALLTNQWILTAAQCAEDALTFKIQLGSNTLSNDDPNRLTLATSTFILHPDYDPATLYNDLALIKLRLPVQFNDYVRAITLPENPVSDHETVTGLGWGQMDDFNTGISNELHFVPLTTISIAECQLVYGAQITDQMVCVAGSYNEGICNGDMGGPLIQMINNNAQHVGVASFRSHNGCETMDPSGYTRTASYLPWIKSVTGL